MPRHIEAPVTAKLCVWAIIRVGFSSDTLERDRAAPGTPLLLVRPRIFVCDLERRRTIALLPDRELATAEAWVRKQPQTPSSPTTAAAI